MVLKMFGYLFILSGFSPLFSGKQNLAELETWMVMVFSIVVGYFMIKYKPAEEETLPEQCDMCDIEFTKKNFKWEVSGKTVYLCPSCNTKMKSKASKDKFNKRFEEL